MKTKKPLKIMEVCGTHTHAIAKSGLKDFFDGEIDFISGPGCPVCVSAQSDIDKMISLALMPNITIMTFGDMMRVPGSKISLQGAAQSGADVKIVYSPLDAVIFALQNPKKQVVFLAVGFETTAPLIAAAILKAKELKLKNFFIYSCLKTITPAIKTILDEKNDIDGFLLPGNVSVITGWQAFDFISKKYKKPAVAAGFSPKEIIEAAKMLLATKTPKTQNVYRWASPKGNKEAQKAIKKVFSIGDGVWRGLGKIAGSALVLKSSYKNFDAEKVFKIKKIKETKTKCRCALILKGKLKPSLCPFFAKTCTPTSPLGPCMVSSEGACAAWYNNLK